MSTRIQIPMKPAAAPARALAPAPFGTLQRKCACGGLGGSGGGCEECKKKKLQRSAAGRGPEMAPPIVHDVLRSPGQPLDAATRASMEPRFGHDFSKVRIHADARASESARSVNALAYTVGPQIVFGAGLYQPGARSGQQLLAHELTHVVQQHGQSAAGHPLRVGPSTDSYEQEAERAASATVNAGAFHSTEHASGLIQRQATEQPSDPRSSSTPAPAPGVTPPSPPLPGPASSRIDIRDAKIDGVPGLFRHLFIVYHDGTTGNEFAWRGGHTKGKLVCPGVGLPDLRCPFNDLTLGAIGVGPLREPFKPGATDWPALDTRTLVQGPAADGIGAGACFDAEAARISAACVPYSPCGPNSNSVAYTLLTKCGIPAEVPAGLAIHPGWGTLV